MTHLLLTSFTTQYRGENAEPTFKFGIWSAVAACRHIRLLKIALQVDDRAVIFALKYLFWHGRAGSSQEDQPFPLYPRRVCACVRVCAVRCLRRYGAFDVL